MIGLFTSFKLPTRHTQQDIGLALLSTPMTVQLDPCVWAPYSASDYASRRRSLRPTVVPSCHEPHIPGPLTLFGTENTDCITSSHAYNIQIGRVVFRFLTSACDRGNPLTDESKFRRGIHLAPVAFSI